MAITRSGPVHNMDTNQPLVMLPPNKRFTRCQAHRLLKTSKILHDQGAPMSHLLYLIEVNNIRPVFLPPGKIEDPVVLQKIEIKTKVIEVKNEKKIVGISGLPNNVPKLRVICKEKKIPFKRDDNKETLIRRITENVENTP